MRASPALALLIALSLALPVAALAQPAEAEPDLRAEIEALKQGQQEIRRELAQIKQLLQTRQAPSRPAGPDVRDVVFELGDNPVKGEATAALTLIEFADYQCGFCARHLNQTFPRLESEYIATGKLRYTMLDMPLDMHPLAFKAAEVAHCAGEQGKYWEMHDRLFANQRSLEPWSGHADALGLDRQSFDECVESGRQAETVRRHMAEARKASVSGTPSFVLALTNSADPSKVKGLHFIRGAQPFEAFKRAIDEQLGEVE